MDPKLAFFCYLGAGLCFLLAALGGTKSGKLSQPAVLLPMGLLLFTLPTLWNQGEAAF